MKVYIAVLNITLFILTFLLFVSSVSAEIDSSKVEWQNEETAWYAPDDPRGIDTIQKKYETLYSDSNLSCFFRHLKKQFDSSSIDWSSNPDVKQKFIQELDTMILESSQFDSRIHNKRGKLTNLDSLIDTLLKVMKTNRFSKGSDQGMIVFFKGKQSAIPLRLCTDGSSTNGCLTAQQAIDIRLRAKTIDQFFNRYKEPIRKRLHEQVLASSKAWKNYLNNSPFLFPWELFLNGFTCRKSNLWTPPGHKLLLLHPSLGIMLTGLQSKSIDSMAVNQVLSVECGYIRYLDNNRSNSLGVGVLSCIGGQDPVHCGVALHWNSTMVGAAIPVKHFDDPNKIAIVGSVDIIGLANWAKKEADQLVLDKFQELVKN
jgi:hypothetical protein